MDSIKNLISNNTEQNNFKVLNNTIVQGFQQIIKNQNIIYNLLNNFIKSKNNNNIAVRPIRFLTPRQLYFMTKDGYTIDEISLISGFEYDDITKKINQYVQNNT